MTWAPDPREARLEDPAIHLEAGRCGARTCYGSGKSSPDAKDYKERKPMPTCLKRALPLLSAALLVSSATANAQLGSRITHYDLGKTKEIKAVHDGAGSMNFGPLMTDKTLSTNFIFLHRGVLHAHGGIGQHFHNHCE
jgi:hypothetical protein